MVDHVAVMYAGRIVEAGPVERIFTSPWHPYTQGLLESMPTRSRRGERLKVIKGSVPNPFNMPVGCNFAPRCPARFAPCGEHDPALLQVEDRVSMANSLESRVPLLDHRLVDLVASMPAGRKFARGELKYLLKRAAGDLIPTRVLDRRDKMGFPVPMHLWVRGASRDFVHDLLLSQRARQRGLFDTASVAALLETEPPFSRRVWGLLNLELWHRLFIDHPSSSPLS